MAGRWLALLPRSRKILTPPSAPAFVDFIVLEFGKRKKKAVFSTVSDIFCTKLIKLLLI